MCTTSPTPTGPLWALAATTDLLQQTTLSYFRVGRRPPPPQQQQNRQPHPQASPHGLRCLQRLIQTTARTRQHQRALRTRPPLLRWLASSKRSRSSSRRLLDQQSLHLPKYPLLLGSAFSSLQRSPTRRKHRRLACRTGPHRCRTSLNPGMHPHVDAPPRLIE